MTGGTKNRLQMREFASWNYCTGPRGIGEIQEFNLDVREEGRIFEWRMWGGWNSGTDG